MSCYWDPIDKNYKKMFPEIDIEINHVKMVSYTNPISSLMHAMLDTCSNIFYVVGLVGCY